MSNQFTHPWTQKDIEFIRENIGKLTYKEMGVLINRSYSSVQSKIRFLPFQKKVKKHSVNYNFFKKWTPEMAYVLGFIAADGNICHNGRIHMLHIASDDLDVIEKVKFVMDYLGPIYKKPRPNGKISYNLRICDQTIFYDLENLGITERKSLTLNPRVDKNFITDFLRGFFDGDGTVYIRNTKCRSNLRTRFYTASQLMAKFIYSCLKNLLKDSLNCKINSHISKWGRPYYSIGLGHKASAKLFSIFYSSATIYMERKYQKFISGIKE